MIHALDPVLERRLTSDYRPLQVLVIGAGGNGSKLVMALRHLHTALQALGSRGLHVTLADGDTVSHANLARQAFYPADLGQNKATVLIHRLNIATRADWQALPRMVGEAEIRELRPDLVISCVDTRAARAQVHQALTTREGSSVRYWLDLGNATHTGQVVLGQVPQPGERMPRTRPRTLAELYPEALDTTLPEDDQPSCSTLEALDRQDLFINDLLVTHAANLLWRLLRDREISHHGAFVDARTGTVTPLPIDPNTWRRLQRAHQRSQAA